MENGKREQAHEQLQLEYSEEMQIAFVKYWSDAIHRIKNPTERVKKLHQMLWEL